MQEDGLLCELCGGGLTLIVVAAIAVQVGTVVRVEERTKLVVRSMHLLQPVLLLLINYLQGEALPKDNQNCFFWHHFIKIVLLFLI